MTQSDAKIEGHFTGALDAFQLEARFSFPATGVTGLFGPSGCGKTSFLQCIAGLRRVSGSLTVAGTVWQSDAQRIFRHPHQRQIGYVFQEASLFPHLSVAQNLTFGQARARQRGVSEQIDEGDVIRFLGLRPLLARQPGDLSGGERQRVAIGRALLSQPRLLLLDEPLSALDATARTEIMTCLERLSSQFAIPALYVSHDMRELERLADTLVLMEAGQIVAAGSLSAIQSDPSLPLLHMIDAAVTMKGRVQSIDESYHLLQVGVDGGTLTVSGKDMSEGDTCRLSIKASDVSFVTRPARETSILNCLPARVVSIDTCQRDPAHLMVLVVLDDRGEGEHIVGRITRKSGDRMGLEPGKPVFAQIKSIAVMRSAKPPC
ncbi:molybdenum ABC transporter ATP-binding protein [Parvularcula sp. IMCC14364]|uniref:molybdenum ABC transporter ATP-binding protein n=1 Tax=Parvularcula sp. IMCC14364 TaxID=3067902 RepID=UPI0027427712|nr:molybdenum ABC transporter ATP-binding protein [Parvularcula sp. IMCC14364]